MHESDACQIFCLKYPGRSSALYLNPHLEGQNYHESIKVFEFCGSNLRPYVTLTRHRLLGLALNCPQEPLKALWGNIPIPFPHIQARRLIFTEDYLSRLVSRSLSAMHPKSRASFFLL